MRQSSRVLATLVTVAIVAAIVVFAYTWRNGLAADRPPSHVESAVARRLVQLSIPAAEREQRSPSLPADAWRDGSEHFLGHCAVCHGADGRGHSAFGPRMYPPVPDLGSADVQALSDGALFAIIENGVRWTGMPAFRGTHSPDETWKLVAFVRHVPQERRPELQASLAK